MISQCKIQFTNSIRHFRIDVMQTFVKHFVTFAMQHGEVIVIGEIVFAATGWNVVTMIVIATACVHLRLAAQIVVVAGRVSWTTPFCAY